MTTRFVCAPGQPPRKARPDRSFLADTSPDWLATHVAGLGPADKRPSPTRCRRRGWLNARTMDGLVRGDDGVERCWWADSATEYRAYHDGEWGFPVADDVRLFEKLSLEGFRAGLSWLTILRKREAFRSAFVGFDFERIARFGARDVGRLLADASIVRHRGKRGGWIAQRWRSWPSRPSRRRSRRTSSGVGGGSLDRPRCTRSWRRWGS